MPRPIPTPIFRILHVDNLAPCLEDRGLRASNDCPDTPGRWRSIHDEDVQAKRKDRAIPCGPRGNARDYVPFYLGPRSPMLLQLHTGQVAGYAEKQDPIVYVTSTVERVLEAGLPFVFSDGHGLARFTNWYDDPARLDDGVDWQAAYAIQWNDTAKDMDRQRRKQAEFLIHRFAPWELVEQIAVVSEATARRVRAILEGHDPALHRPVVVRRDWYY